MDGLKFKTVIFLVMLTFLACISGVSANTAINTTYIIDTPGNYYLTGNITSNTAKGIDITCSDVVLDGQGYFIDGAGHDYTGIYASGVSNITIKNVNIGNFSGGNDIYFSEVNNSLITNNSLESNGMGSGIHLWHSYDNNITNNAVSSNNWGIQLQYSLNNIIANNTANSNEEGIYVSSSSNNIIANNTANSNSQKGISLDSSLNNTIKNNNVSSNYYGIYLMSSLNNTITDNTANSNTYDGIYLYSSSLNNIIANNNVSSNRCGITLSSSNNNIIANNTANSNNQRGISLSSSNNIIANNNVSSNTYDGIYLYSSSNNLITNNNVSSNGVQGIQLYTSSNNIIANNTANSNIKYGIYLYSSSNNLITNNNANSNSQYGIYLSSSNDNNTVTNNTANSNVEYGIILSSSSNNIIANNTANSNIKSGISLHSSNNNTFTNNNVSSNVEYGIILQLSEYNQIYHNIFNNTDTCQIVSCGVNYWNTSKELGGGNYWFKINGTGWSETHADLNNDGFCDEPYELSTNNTDYLPKLLDIVAPEVTLNTPVNETTYNTSSILINVTATDASKISVVAEIGSVKNVTLSLNGSYYLGSTGNLSDGVYNITATAKDECGNTNTTEPITITVDTSAPLVTINGNKSSYKGYTNILNVTVTDATSVSVLAEINNGSILQNITLENISGYFGNSTYEFTEGEYFVRIYANDTFGHLNSSENVTFRVDLTAPIITVNTVEGAYFNNGSNVINFTINESYIDSVTAFNGSTEILLENSTGNYLNAAELADGFYNLIIRINDTAGNTVNKTVNFTVDTINPEVTINAPITGTSFTTNSATINVTANDSLSNVSSVVAEIGSIGNLILSFDGEYYIGNTGTLSNGNYKITIYVRDLAGNVNSNENVTITIAAPSSSSSGIGGGGMGSYPSDLSNGFNSTVIRSTVSDSNVVYGNSIDEYYAKKLRESLYSSEGYEINRDTIIVGGPESNALAKQYNNQFEVPISNEYPGEYIGVIQIQNLQVQVGNFVKTYQVIYIAGSDRYGTEAALEYFKTLDGLPSGPITVEWTANGPKVVE